MQYELSSMKVACEYQITALKAGRDNILWIM
ncbi:MAG: hypothetical protein RLZZ399_925 [Verrucomicrobiota bacterium]|jgi:hypothetical protein